jgi:hypothetical protein
VQQINDAFEAVATQFSGAVDPAAYAGPYMLWADTGTGNLKRRNAANSAWDIVGKIFPPVEQSFGNKTVLINGNFNINQRGVSGTVSIAAGVYGHDRWKAGASGCTYTFSTAGGITTLNITAGSLVQVVEGLNLVSGTYTLSWTGTAQGKIGAGGYGSTGITGSATGGTNLSVEFNAGTLALARFELGSVATPFEFRSIGTELGLCQRYYEELYARWGTFNAQLANQQNCYFKVRKRTTPTFVTYADTTPYAKTGATGNVRNRTSSTDVANTISIDVGQVDCAALNYVGANPANWSATLTISSEL